jgi:inosine-uridine nucleoside N-ribohydrolase
VLDTDPGIDDALAILFGPASPEVETAALSEVTLCAIGPLTNVALALHQIFTS